MTHGCISGAVVRFLCISFWTHLCLSKFHLWELFKWNFKSTMNFFIATKSLCSEIAVMQISCFFIPPWSVFDAGFCNRKLKRFPRQIELLQLEKNCRFLIKSCLKFSAIKVCYSPSPKVIEIILIDLLEIFQSNFSIVVVINFLMISFSSSIDRFCRNDRNTF